MNRWDVISGFGLFLFLGITMSAEFSHAAAKLTLHGKILKPDNTPVNSSSVSFQIQIRSPGVENCLLYQETQTLNLSSNPGIFNLSIGSGTRPASTVDGGFTLNQIFQNRNLIDLSAAPGACTNPATSYTPAADDQRNISIQFNDGSGWQSVTAQKINPVPRALDSGQVGGYDSAQLLRVADGVPTAQTELSGAQWTELLAVISGTSTVYSKPNQLNGVNLPALSNGQTMVWNAGAWTAVTPQALPGGGTNGQVLTSDGAGGATWTAAGTTNAGSLSAGTLADARLSSNVVLKNASNTFSIGNQNITNGAPTEVNLILKGAAAQSANMLEVRNSADTLLYSVETSGTPVANTDLANKAYVDSANSTSSANAVRKDGTTALTGNWGVGNFDITGIKNIGTSGYWNQSGMAAPALSAGGEGRIYFDSTSNTFKVSQNGGAYTNLVGGSGGGDVSNGGNSFGVAMSVGTNDNNSFSLKTNNTARLTIANSGAVSGNVPMSLTNTETATGQLSTLRGELNISSALAGQSYKGVLGYADFYGNVDTYSVSGGYFEAVRSNGPVAGATSLNGVIGSASDSGQALAHNISSVNGVVSKAQIGGFHNAPQVVGFSGSMMAAGTGDTTNMIGVSLTGVKATTNLTNYYGTKIENMTNPIGTFSNFYGLYVGTVAATNRYALYSVDTATKSYHAGDLGIGSGVTAPSSALDINGAITEHGMAAPAVSAAGQGRIYFDSTANTFKVSQNGGVYADLVPTGGAVGGTGTQNSITKWNNASGALVDSNLSDDGTTVTVAASKNLALTSGSVQFTGSPAVYFTNNVNDASSLLTGGWPSADNIVFGKVAANPYLAVGRYGVSQSIFQGMYETGQDTVFFGNSYGIVGASGGNTIGSTNMTGMTVSQGSADIKFYFGGTQEMSISGGTYISANKNFALQSGTGTFTQTYTGTGDAATITANSLTSGNILRLTTSSNSLNSTSGLLNVANTGTSTSGMVARIQSNTTAGSGLSVWANGNVGIGTATPTQALEVVGTVQATDFVSTSDRRLKRDIANIENALDKILKINGVTWKWISDGTADMGVIAQDVEKVFPEAVVTSANGKKSVKYGNLIGPMVEAVKSLKSENDQLAQKVEVLQSENDELKLRLERLEKLMEKNSKSEGQ